MDNSARLSCETSVGVAVVDVADGVVLGGKSGPDRICVATVKA